MLEPKHMWRAGQPGDLSRHTWILIKVHTSAHPLPHIFNPPPSLAHNERLWCVILKCLSIMQVQESSSADQWKRLRSLCTPVFGTAISKCWDGVPTFPCNALPQPHRLGSPAPFGCMCYVFWWNGKCILAVQWSIQRDCYAVISCYALDDFAATHIPQCPYTWQTFTVFV